MKKLGKVNRIEIIDWTPPVETGRAFCKWIDKDFHAYYDLQDKGKTLKIFLTDKDYGKK
jgi:hypothetical protein